MDEYYYYLYKHFKVLQSVYFLIVNIMQEMKCLSNSNFK